jgi:hypothetical protein
MGIQDKANDLYERANDSFGRHGIIWAVILFVLPFISASAIAFYLAATAEWYWQHFAWLGVWIAVLLTWILLGTGLFLIKNIFDPAWLRPKPAALTQQSPLEIKIKKDLDWRAPLEVLTTYFPELNTQLQQAWDQLAEFDRNMAEGSANRPAKKGDEPFNALMKSFEYAQRNDEARKPYLDRCNELLTFRLKKLQHALESGELSAQAFVTPRSRGTPPAEIPKEEWRLLKFDLKDQSLERVTATGLEYVALRIAKTPAAQSQATSGAAHRNG